MSRSIDWPSEPSPAAVRILASSPLKSPHGSSLANSTRSYPMPRRSISAASQRGAKPIAQLVSV